MMQADYNSAIIAINSANLTANVRNVEINEQLLKSNKRHENDNDRIISLLAEILEEVRKK